MSRPFVTRPSKSVNPLKEKGEIIGYTWSIRYPMDGLTAHKCGKCTTSPILKEMGMTKSRAIKEAENRAHAAADAFILTIGKEAKQKEHTVTTWLDYVNEMIYPDRSATPGYRAAQRAAIERYFLPTYGEMLLKSVTPEHCRAWWRWLRDTEHTQLYANGAGRYTHARKVKLGFRSVNGIRQAVSSMFQAAVKDGKINFNPIAATEISLDDTRKYKKTLKASKKWFSVDELKVVLEACQDSYIYPAILLQRDLALRISEACGLRLRDVNIETGYVKIEVQLKRHRGIGLVEGDTKTEAGVRPGLRLSPEAMALVRKRIAEEEAAALQGRPPCPYVACTPQRKPVSSDWVSKLFRRAVEAAGIDLPKNNATHAMRRTMMKLLQPAGVSMDTLKLFAGHVDEEMVKLYTDDGSIRDETNRELGLISDLRDNLCNSSPPVVQPSAQTVSVAA